jgi:hypothetical protein
LRVRLIDGLNCTPLSFKEKPLSRKLTVLVLETIRAPLVALSFQFPTPKPPSVAHPRLETAANAPIISTHHRRVLTPCRLLEVCSARMSGHLFESISFFY